MKIILCYKEFELGELTYSEGEYTFVPVSGCELAKQKYIVPRASKLIDGGIKKDSALFGEYAYFLKLLQNNYIKSEANIIDGDSDFDKLIKISRLNLDRGSFYLKSRR